MKIQEGEVFAIRTEIGYGFLQYVTTGDLGIELIRVLEPIKQTNHVSQDEVNLKERYSIHFVVKAALRKKVIERSGLFAIPNNYKIPTKARTKHIIRDEFLGWLIIDQKTIVGELKHELSADDILLSPHGIRNDALLIERLEDDWRLENWK